MCVQETMSYVFKILLFGLIYTLFNSAKRTYQILSITVTNLVINLAGIQSVGLISLQIMQNCCKLTTYLYRKPAQKELMIKLEQVPLLVSKITT